MLVGVDEGARDDIAYHVGEHMRHDRRIYSNSSIRRVGEALIAIYRVDHLD